MYDGLYTTNEVVEKTGIPRTTIWRYHKKYDVGRKINKSEIVFTEEEIPELQEIRGSLRRDYDHNS